MFQGPRELHVWMLRGAEVSCMCDSVQRRGASQRHTGGSPQTEIRPRVNIMPPAIRQLTLRAKISLQEVRGVARHQNGVADAEVVAAPQFLASRGCVVVEPEFRGSAGYGVDHQVAGWRQRGLAMQDDMQDALPWAIVQGIVDSSGVCIMGASYGGYAALMGPVRYPEAYRCAISWVAPTTWRNWCATG